MKVRELIAKLREAAGSKNYDILVQDDIAGGDYYIGSKILGVDFNITDEDKVVMTLRIDTHDGEEEYFEFENLEEREEYKEDLDEQKLSENVNLVTAAKKLKRMFDGDPQYFDEAADIIIYWYEREDNINALKDPYLSDILDLLDVASNPKQREIVAKAIGPEADFIFDDEDDLDEELEEDQYSTDTEKKYGIRATQGSNKGYFLGNYDRSWVSGNSNVITKLSKEEAEKLAKQQLKKYGATVVQLTDSLTEDVEDDDINLVVKY